MENGEGHAEALEQRPVIKFNQKEEREMKKAICECSGNHDGYDYFVEETEAGNYYGRVRIPEGHPIDYQKEYGLDAKITWLDKTDPVKVEGNYIGWDCNKCYSVYQAKTACIGVINDLSDLVKEEEPKKERETCSCSICVGIANKEKEMDNDECSCDICESDKQIVEVTKAIAAIEAHNKERARPYYIEERAQELAQEYCDCDESVHYELVDAITRVLRNNDVDVDSDAGIDDPAEEEFNENGTKGGRGFIGVVESDYIKKMIKVQMDYMLDQGKGGLECRKHVGDNGIWREASTPTWNWGEYEYRMKKSTMTMRIDEVAEKAGREVKIIGAVSYDSDGNAYMISSRMQ